MAILVPAIFSVGTAIFIGVILLFAGWGLLTVSALGKRLAAV